MVTADSVGSLGKEAKEAGVQNVTVTNVVFTGSTNGLRIKSWARSSTGFAKGIVFDGATMNNVDNPIIIDQHYCPNNQGCTNQVTFLIHIAFCSCQLLQSS